MFEGTYSPPFYLDLYNFKDGAQEDIFSDSYTYIPPPSETQREIPIPVHHMVPQQISTEVRRENSVVRTMGGPNTLGPLAQALFSGVVLYTGGLF